MTSILKDSYGDPVHLYTGVADGLVVIPRCECEGSPPSLIGDTSGGEEMRRQGAGSRRINLGFAKFC